MNENPLEVLRNEFSELARWLEPLCRFKELEDFLVIDHKDKQLYLTFYTKDNEYHITARLPDVEKLGNGEMLTVDGYLGAIVTTRKSRAGEDWKRGRDLADGKYLKETWQRIVSNIVAFELVKVVKQKETKIRD